MKLNNHFSNDECIGKEVTANIGLDRDWVDYPDDGGDEQTLRDVYVANPIEGKDALLAYCQGEVCMISGYDEVKQIVNLTNKGDRALCTSGDNANEFSIPYEQYAADFGIDWLALEAENTAETNRPFVTDRGFLKHESYGVIQLSRCQRPETALFGSSLKHENTIRLRVSPGELERRYNGDYVYPSHSPKNAFVDVEMSYTQFAEAITSLNQGIGVPVTVRYANGRAMEDCPFINKDEQFRAEFNADLKDLAATADSALKYVRELFENKKTLSKADKDGLISILRSLSQDVNSNIPFVRDRFVEQMDKTVTEAKGNFEGFVQNRMNALANTAIAQNLEGLGGKTALLEVSGNEGKPSVLERIRAGLPSSKNHVSREHKKTANERD